MAVNKYQPHLFVIPEDDANRQMALGFEKDHRVRAKALQVVAPAGGWLKAIELLSSQYYWILEKNSNSHVLIIIDCDDDSTRTQTALQNVPVHLQDRVLIIGALVEPEDLRKSLNKTLEEIGAMVANDCFNDNHEFWKHEKVQHNASEIERLRLRMKPFVLKP